MTQPLHTPQAPPTAVLTLAVHNTPRDMWDTFARVFTPSQHNATTWIRFTAEGVEVTLFAPRLPATPSDAEAA